MARCSHRSTALDAAGAHEVGVWPSRPGTRRPRRAGGSHGRISAPAEIAGPSQRSFMGGEAPHPSEAGHPGFELDAKLSSGPGRSGTAKAGCPASAGVPRGGGRSPYPLEPVRAKGKGNQGMRASSPKDRGSGPSRRRRRPVGALGTTQAVGRRDVAAGTRPHARKRIRYRHSSAFE